MKSTHYTLILLLLTVSSIDLFPMYRLQTALLMQKALSSKNPNQLNRLRSILRRNRSLITEHFRGRPLVHYAQTSEGVDLIASCGADLQAEDRCGYSALHNAHDTSITLALLKNGVHVSLENSQGQTALFTAHSARQIALLVQLGANVNKRDMFGRTALFYARNSAIAKALLRAGAQVDVMDNDGKTSLQVLSKTNPEAARAIEYYVQQRAEKREAQRHKRSHSQPSMIWRPKEKPNIEPETNEPILYPAVIVQNLETEAEQEEYKEDANNHFYDNNNPFASLRNDDDDTTQELVVDDTVEQANTAAQERKDQDDRIEYVSQKPVETKSNPVPSAESTDTQTAIQPAPHLVHQNPYDVLQNEEDDNESELVLVGEAPIQTTTTQPTQKAKHKKHKIKKVIVVKPASTTKKQTRKAIIMVPVASRRSEQEEHIEYVPQYRATHVTSAAPRTPVASSSSSSSSSSSTSTTTSTQTTVPSSVAPASESTTANTTTLNTTNANFFPFTTNNYVEITEALTPDSLDGWEHLDPENAL